MKVLFISYYFEPFPGVGAKRLSYWFNRCSDFGIEPTVLTATEQPEKRVNVHYITPKTPKGWLKHLIKDEGIAWKNELKYFLDAQKTFEYDFVLISGGPFMHFGLSRYLKHKWNTSVILDFRDPFSVNPSFNDGALKVAVKSYFEKQFIKHAAAVIAVNKYCAELIASKKRPIHIIDNGFDESAVQKQEQLEQNTKPIIAHAGTFIHGVRSPEVFLKVLNSKFEKDIVFRQYGKDSVYFEPYRQRPFFEYQGMVSYKKLVQELQAADMCILITEGKSFESTTKVFDYIGLNKKILIITNGEPRSGNLHHLTAEYPNVVWCKNEELAIEKGIKELMNLPVKDFDAHRYSRRYSLEKLVYLLENL